MALRGKNKAIHRPSSSFQSEIPTSQSKKQPTYVHYTSNPDIPVSFERNYINTKDGDADSDHDGLHETLGESNMRSYEMEGSFQERKGQRGKGVLYGKLS
ncbi:hypothetical protein M5689_001702 [Euphorbia peplus]|nr:hypothetical protein M5689_001702 [Euphorbia peplus]